MGRLLHRPALVAAILGFWVSAKDFAQSGRCDPECCCAGAAVVERRVAGERAQTRGRSELEAHELRRKPAFNVCCSRNVRTRRANSALRTEMRIGGRFVMLARRCKSRLRQST